MRPRSATASTRPRSKYILLSSLERRTSLDADDLGRALAWPDAVSDVRQPAAGPSGECVARGADLERQMALRRRVALELYESEKSYVAGLAAVDSLYYTPLYRALESDAIVSRSTLNRMFSNFVDILQLSRELLCRLEERVGDPLAVVGASGRAGARDVAEWDPWTDALGDLLVPIAPFFKMYTLYMQNFASAMQCIADERGANERFASFLQRAEASAAELGGGAELGLAAQLLTVVQRVPRYRLLLHQLLQNTPVWHADHAALQHTYRVVEQTASLINEHVRQQELTLVALALQRRLVGLDEPLVVPGRRLLRYGTLLKTRRKNIQPRHVYLFSDCLLLASAAALGEAAADALGDDVAVAGEHALSLLGGGGGALALTHKLPLAECTVVAYDEPALPLTGLPQSMSMPDLSASVGRAPLQLRHRFDVHSPQCSFSLYASTGAAKHAWITAIREAHAEHIAAMRSLRKSDSPPARRASSSSSTSSSSLSRLSDAEAAPAAGAPPSPVRTPRTAAHAVSALLSPRREARPPLLEHYQAPVWVPDSFSVRCARCVEPFTLWRRKHHCRLCGQVFCAACSAAHVLLPSGVPGMPEVRARVCAACHAAAHETRTPAAPPAALAPPAVLPSTPPTPRGAAHALRPVLGPTPTQAADSLADITNAHTPRPRSKHARRWSIVSVPVPGGDGGTPPCHVHASTSGTLTLQLCEARGDAPGRAAASSAPATPCEEAPALVRAGARSARAPGRPACSPRTSPPRTPPAPARSAAAQWLQTMLVTPPTPRAPVRTP